MNSHVSVQIETYKKEHAAVVHTLNLSRGRKFDIKGSYKQCNFEMMEACKSFDFILPSRETGDVWLSGLCSLVSS